MLVEREHPTEQLYFISGINIPIPWEKIRIISRKGEGEEGEREGEGEGEGEEEGGMKEGGTHNSRNCIK